MRSELDRLGHEHLIVCHAGIDQRNHALRSQPHLGELVVEVVAQRRGYRPHRLLVLETGEDGEGVAHVVFEHHQRRADPARHTLGRAGVVPDRTRGLAYTRRIVR